MLYYDGRPEVPLFPLTVDTGVKNLQTPMLRQQPPYLRPFPYNHHANAVNTISSMITTFYIKKIRGPLVILPGLILI